MRKCFSLIGQGSAGWLLVGCLVLTCLQVRCQEVDEEDHMGEYGSECTVNSDCNLGFSCVLNTCDCERSHMFDMKTRICKKICRGSSEGTNDDQYEFYRRRYTNCSYVDVCRGSSEGLVKHGTNDDQYEFYRRRYTNCSYIDGNLELSALEKQYDLSFLRHIEEVEGYVVIVNVLSNYLHLRNLRIIRGKTLYEGKYSLYIALNHNPRNESEGLLELQFTSLKEIMAGQAYFHNNNLLCFDSTIRWDDINPNVSPPMKIVFDSKNYKRACGQCHHSCYNAVTGHYHCWGSGPDMCQELNKVKGICSETCDGRCFGSQPNQCCHSECAAGCTSQKKTDCITCKNFYNEGECHPFCPKMEKYDSSLMKWVKDPNGRYAFGPLCVKECPSYLIKDNGACVIKCPEGKMADPETNECIQCEGACPKKCTGLAEHDFLTSQNIQNFTGCTVIEGNMRIVKASFTGDSYTNTEPLAGEDLWVLKNVKEITGYLIIQETPENVRNLSFLAGLEVIHGRYISVKFALSVLKLHIESLSLTSLRQISNGDVMIAMNKNLCYVDPIDFSPLFPGPNQKLTVGRNNNKSVCAAEGHVCDIECSYHGCWGPGPDSCIQCRNMVLEGENICISSCNDLELLYNTSQTTCKRCHEQCAEGCSGPGADECFACKKVAMEGENGSRVCMDKCPEVDMAYMYPDENRVCKPCDPSCEKGCTGPSTTVKLGGCMTCELAINETHQNGTVHCLPHDQEWCPTGYYLQQFRSTVSYHPLMKKPVCQPCHPLCKECDGSGNGNCPVCKYLKYRSVCLDSCPQYTFATNGSCVDCHEQCLDCNGPNNTNCVKCKMFKIMHNDKNNTFECVEKCPPHLPEFAHDTDPDKPTKTVCADLNHPEVRAENIKNKDAERKRLMTIIIPTCIGVLILGGLLVVFGYCWRQRERAKENTVKLTARMTGLVDAEPLTPTDAKPDLSKLRLIRESELRRGGIIGSGAFGTVYKGFWIPDGENVKIPVAIKILQEGTSPNQNQELLEEARVMASVEHPCCIRILAVCMASQMMLITQLMPLGCLLDYIRKHKEHTGSKSLLNWCTQIARGMSYLEERGIVHRDLAARNVLVQSAGQVKITDFGLAKLLDYNEEEYHAAGGKMPIKWLALECIQCRIFTHKSDVWSYGVTVWELFTYGSRPYESVRARDVPDLLEKGERLPQPNICTIDVYMIMIKCWMLDADSRPSFAELAEEFAKMARDPGRFLVIPGDTLMRLPSYSYDKDDLARHLSVAGDGPEEVIEADDYLQPAPPVPNSPDNNNIKNPMLAHPGGATNKEPSQLIREKRYGHLESAAAARQQRELSPNRVRGDSINGRYSSDPVKYVRNRDEPDGNVVLRAPPVGNGNVPGYGGMAHKKPYEPDRILHLPLDEDDYLQPQSTSNPKAYLDLVDGKGFIYGGMAHKKPYEPERILHLPLYEDYYLQPQSTSNPKAYLDLVDGKDYYLNEKQMPSAPQQDGYLVPTPSSVPSVFENPEYFEGDMQNNGPFGKPMSPISPTSSVSPVSPVSPISPISPTSRNSVKPKIAPKPKRLTDYYNDVGGNESRRENTPLLSNTSSNCSNGESAV